jgi:hypothetical protein
MVLVTFYLALLAGLGLDAIGRVVDAQRSNATLGWLRLAVVPLVVVVTCADLFVVNLKTINRWDGPPSIAGPAAERFGLVPPRNLHGLYASLPARHQGTAACYNGGMNWLVSPALWSGDVPQVRSVPMGAGDVLSFARTVNSMTLRVRASQGRSRFVINQNFDRDFHTNLGETVDDRGLLALDVPAGEHEIHVTYQPQTLAAGLGLSGLGWFIAIGAWWALSRRMSKGST